MIYSANHLSGKTFLVTGASSGIGHATAIMLANSGAKVIACGRDKDRLNMIFSELPNAHMHTLVLKSLDDADGVTDWMKQIAKEHGPLSGVFHSAGIELIRPVRMIKNANMNSLFSSSLFAGFGIASAASQRNVMEDGSSLVFMSSVAGQTGQAGMTAYSAAKAGIDGLVRSLACELAARKIRVNSIAAGAVNTSMHERLLISTDEVSKNAYQSSHLLGFGQPIDVANAALFLLSDASKWITGTVMVVDGGYMVR